MMNPDRNTPGARPARLRARVGATLAAAALAAAAAAGLPRPASAAAAPIAGTGSARNVGYGTVVVTGYVVPDGLATSYYFQYGTTKAYGGQSAIGSAGAGGERVSVAQIVSGLAPATAYHYRLVAVNAAGTATGSDRTLFTAAIPLSVTLAVTPSPVPWGGNVSVHGTVSGTGSAGCEVVLQADPFGSAFGFIDVGAPAVTDGAGGFAFIVPGMQSSTRYRIVVVASPPAISPTVTAAVAVRVSSRVRHGAGPHRVRFSGTVTPAENGDHVAILRIVSGRGVPVAAAVLHPDGPARSSFFSRTVRVRPGVYRVLALVAGAQVSAYGPPLLIR